jgi:hypothetical protein
MKSINNVDINKMKYPALPKVYMVKATSSYEDEDAIEAKAQEQMNRSKNTIKPGDLIVVKNQERGSGTYIVDSNINLEKVPMDGKGQAYIMPKYVLMALKNGFRLNDIVRAYNTAEHGERFALRGVIYPPLPEYLDNVTFNKQGELTSMVGYDYEKKSSTMIDNKSHEIRNLYRTENYKEDLVKVQEYVATKAVHDLLKIENSLEPLPYDEVISIAMKTARMTEEDAKAFYATLTKK